MTWAVEWTGPALRDMKRLDRQTADRVRRAMLLLAETGRADIRFLRAKGPRERRVRVGDWRVRFTFDPTTRTIRVLRVLPRGRAYRD